MSKTIIIYNPGSSGHQLEFFEYLYHHFGDITDREILFFLNKKDKIKYKDIISSANNCIVHYSHIANSRLKETKELLSFAKQRSATSIFFMMLDYYIPSLRKVELPKSLKIIGGIYFRPFVRNEEINLNIRAKLIAIKDYFKGYLALKRLDYTLISQNINTSLLVLNDMDSVERLSKVGYKKIRFKYLVDPLNKKSTKFSPDFNLKEKHSISKAKKIILIAGAIDARKNIIQLINAIKSDSKLKSQLTLVISGFIFGNYLNEIKNEAEGKIDFRIENRWLNYKEFGNYISQSDFVFICYERFYFSSGILSLAAFYEKSVIGPNVGLMKELILENNLGVVANPFSKHSIAKSIRKLLKKGIFHGKKEGVIFSADDFNNNIQKTLFSN